jgi:hypothetical protein
VNAAAPPEQENQSGSANPDKGSFSIPGRPSGEYTDGRLPGDWQTKYPAEARRCINQEACALALGMILFSTICAILLGMAGQTIIVPLDFFAKQPDAATVLRIDIKWLSIFFIGCLGGTTFSVKWLIHSAAKSKWHLDRRYWRLFVPLIGGVYACVMLTLLDFGVVGSHGGQPREMAVTAAYAFLVGYFSDGVSGLLSNIANAVFGTLEKK